MSKDKRNKKPLPPARKELKLTAEQQERLRATGADAAKKIQAGMQDFQNQQDDYQRGLDRVAETIGNIEPAPRVAESLHYAIESVIMAIEAKPRIFSEKEPEWSEGLNATQVNALAAKIGLGPIIEVPNPRVKVDVQDRELTFHDSDGQPPVKMRTWSPTPEIIRRVINYLRGWQKKAMQLPSANEPDSRVAADRRIKTRSKRGKKVWGAIIVIAAILGALGTWYFGILDRWFPRGQ